MGAIVFIVCICLLTGFIFNRFLDYLEAKKEKKDG